jgi:hypothetical protein
MMDQIMNCDLEQFVLSAKEGNPTHATWSGHKTKNRLRSQLHRAYKKARFPNPLSNQCEQERLAHQTLKQNDLTKC